MSGQGFKPGSGPLLAAMGALTEASAYRITPTYVYVYKYKDNNKAQGIVPVRIKHANVEKHWKDIVDPEPGDPLANFVIGTLPKSYDAAADLVLKDKKKTLKDVMTKDGPAGAAAAAAQGVPLPGAATPQVLLAETPKNLVLAMGIAPDSQEAEFFGAVYDNKGDAALALEEVVAGQGKKKTTKAIETLVATVAPLTEKAEAQGFIKVTVDENENTTVTFDETKIPKPASAPKPTVAQVQAPPPVAAPAATPADTVAALKVTLANLSPSMPLEYQATTSDGNTVMAASSSLVDGMGVPSWLQGQPRIDKMHAALTKTLEKSAANSPEEAVIKALNSGYATYQIKGALEKSGMQPTAAAAVVNNVLKDLKDAFSVELDKPWVAAPAAAAPTGGSAGTPAASEDDEKTKAFAKTLSKHSNSNVSTYGANGLSVTLAVSVQKELGIHYTQAGANSTALVTAVNEVRDSYPTTGDGLLARHTISALTQTYNVSQVTNALVSAGKSDTQAEELVASVLADLKASYEKHAAKAGTPAAPAASMAPTATATGIGSLSIPPEQTLVHSGSAASLGGKHAKHFFTAGTTGQQFLFKPSNPAQSAAGEVYSALATKILGPEHVVPVKQMQKKFGIGSMQPMVPNVSADLSKLNLTTLTPEQLNSLLRERVADWALSTHDTKAANFLVLTDGSIVGIDKEQAFKFIGSDSLDTTYKPNPTPQVYSQLFDLYKAKKLNLNFSAMQGAIEAVEDIPDDEWMAKAEAYVKELPASEQAEKRAAILARKKSVRKDLEKFITGLMRDRGEIGPKDDFAFAAAAPKRKKKPTAGPGAAAGSLPTSASSPLGSVLTPASLPSVESLFHQGAATNIGGAGAKDFFVDATGKKYLLKYATSKSSGKPEPFKVKSQTMFAQIASVVRPGKVVPVAEVPGGYKGKPATLQPWQDLADKPTVGKNTNPATLTDSEKQDIAEEHVLDWMLSQHDTHGDNLIRRKDGTIVSIDKEQGFKYLNGVSGTEPDVLDVDYQPNTNLYGEAEPYYNKFWRAFAQKKMDFDPAVMLGAIERVEAIPNEQYGNLLSDYLKSNDKLRKDDKTSLAFLDAAMSRKKNIRAEFETFLSKLYQKREGVPGEFKFDTGFVPVGQKPAPSAAKKKKKLTSPVLAVAPEGPGPKPQLIVNPNATGKLGMEGVEVISSTAWTPPEQQKPVTPAGFPEPKPGFQWTVQPASNFFAEKGSYFYKAKPPKDPVTGNPLPDDPYTVAKFTNITAEAVEDAIKQAGVVLEKPVKPKDGKVIVYLKKADLATLQASTKQIGTQVPLPPAPTPPTDLMKSIPKPGQLKNALVTASIDAVDFRDTKLAYGQSVVADGPAVEAQTVMVQRHKDMKGRTFYRYLFKVREEYGLNKGKKSLFTGGTFGEFQHNRMTYSEADDALVHTKGPEGATDRIDAYQWKLGDSTLSLGNPKGTKWACRNRVWADVYPKEGEDPNEAFRALLDAAGGAGAADKVLRPPTEKESLVMKMSALFWSVAPQEADKLSETNRTETYLREQLNKLGYTDKDIASIRMEQVGYGAAVPVLPGRHKKIFKNNKNLAYVAHAFSTADRVVSHLRIGPSGIMARQDFGLQPKGTSTSADLAPDQNSGGGDYLFCKPVTKSDSGKFRWGKIEIVMDPSELDRLDLFAGYGHDPYGNTHDASFQQRQPLESPGTEDKAEIVFKQGFNPNKILKIRAQSEELRNATLIALKNAGITEINGMPVEDLVVFTGNQTLYSTQLQPAGY